MQLDLRKRLEQVLPVPTAPFHEAGIVELLQDFAATTPGVRSRLDSCGNLELVYGPGRPRLLYQAHMDHPAFHANGDGTATARGGIKVKEVVGHRLKTLDGATSVEVSGVAKKPVHTIRLRGGRGLKRGTPLILDLPGIRITKDHVRARVIDDLCSVAICLTVVDRLIKARWKGTLGFLFTRAEEVGFVGVSGWVKTTRYPKSTTIVNMETSRALPHTPLGAGPIVRVGDRVCTFDPEVTMGLTLAAGKRPHQRALMDGGGCEATAFTLAGFSAGAVCLPTKNIHNHKPRGGMGLEYVHKDDAENMVRLLVRYARDFGKVDAPQKIRRKLDMYWKKYRKSL